ncbi:hypothetical protein MKZ12_01055 [Paenibacillus sp. FSL R5-0713]|uniref:hypothetical protein n=1 Tax=Paenibacillus sp. FSL R5-0713 TaxID=2921655 RepID=UPI0030D901E7
MLGIFIVILDGLWIVDVADSYDLYPGSAWALLAIGLCMMIFAYIMIQHKRKQEAPMKDEVQEIHAERVLAQQFVNRMWKDREAVGGRLILSLLIIHAVIAVFHLGLALRMVQITIFVGIICFSFFYIMNDDRGDLKEQEEDLKPESHFMQTFMRLIDYRQHPFSLGLLVFLLIVLTFLISKWFGWEISFDTGGNPLYVMSLPTSAVILSGLAFACGLIYINQHCDFFGLRQTDQGAYRLFQIHFYEIIACGASFFIWLGIIILSWFFA